MVIFASTDDDFTRCIYHVVMRKKSYFRARWCLYILLLYQAYTISTVTTLTMQPARSPTACELTIMLDKFVFLSHDTHQDLMK